VSLPVRLPAFVPHREQKSRNRSKSPLSYPYGDEALHVWRLHHGDSDTGRRVVTGWGG
jgi:hypothetical protein